MQFFAMAIREASVILVAETSKTFSSVQLVDTDMIQASVIWLQQYRFNDCSLIQW